MVPEWGNPVVVINDNLLFVKQTKEANGGK